MKKWLILILCMILLILSLSSCGNYMLIDTNYQFDYAIIAFPDGTSQKIEIKAWTDYEGEQIQIEDTDGNIYLVNSVNCVLIREAKD